ncbi:MAG: hypothetical protein CMH64_00665 [Nanoarchaeota archaeon]|nr:hypothetical protein [Nanoarchaeota archaeon]|tara:strand:- start:752 stop:1018 length:267 start_codon:yes stop_codon:yes gene_type:complete
MDRTEKYEELFGDYRQFLAEVNKGKFGDVNDETHGVLEEACRDLGNYARSVYDLGDVAIVDETTESLAERLNQIKEKLDVAEEATGGK